MPSNSHQRPTRALFATAAACLALSACGDDSRFGQKIPVDDLPATLAAPLVLAPDALELPAVGPAPIGRLVSRDDSYAWAERAYALDYAFYEQPPDYGFEYGEIEPWAWESVDEWSLYVEPLDVGNRYYYYEPEADYPYFIRDAEYGYGFDDFGRVVVIYDVAGRLLPERYLIERADVAGRYYTRAKALRRASGESKRRRVERDLWFSRRESLTASQASWIQAAERQDDWRSYRSRTDRRDLRRFDRDRERRGGGETRQALVDWRRDDVRRDDDRPSGFLGAAEQEQVAELNRSREPRTFERAREERPSERRARNDEREIQVAVAEQRGRIEAEGRRARGADGERRQAQARVEGERRQEQARQERRRGDAEAQRERRADNERRQAQQERGRAEAEAQRGRRADNERRQAQARVEGQRRQEQARQERGRAEAEAQRGRRADNERRQAQVRVEGQRRQEQARQERGQAEAEAQRGRRADNERRQAQVRVEGQRRQEQARQERGRAEAEAQRGRRADNERRQAEARAEGQRRQEQARQERGRAEAEAQRGRRAEGERQLAQARAEEQGRRDQARAERERPRAEAAERHAQPAAERQPDRGNDRGGKGERDQGDRGQGRKKD